jgi:hypothetical protein
LPILGQPGVAVQILFDAYWLTGRQAMLQFQVHKLNEQGIGIRFLFYRAQNLVNVRWLPTLPSLFARLDDAVQRGSRRIARLFNRVFLGHVCRS